MVYQFVSVLVIVRYGYGYRLRHYKKGNGFPTIDESQVSTSTSAVSEPHILLIFKRIVVHYCILPRETAELAPIGFAVE